jgi:hypothetical protein
MFIKTAVLAIDPNFVTFLFEVVSAILLASEMFCKVK